MCPNFSHNLSKVSRTIFLRIIKATRYVSFLSEFEIRQNYGEISSDRVFNNCVKEQRETSTVYLIMKIE